MRKFLGKIFGTVELFTKIVIEYEWDPVLRKMKKVSEPYNDPAYINIVKRQKAIRFIMGDKYRYMHDARMSNSISEINKANTYVLENPTKFYQIVDYGKQDGNEVFIGMDPQGYGKIKILVLDEVITMFYDYDDRELHYRKAKSYAT